MSKKKVLLRGVFINRDTNGEGVLKVGTTLIRVSTVMGILYIDDYEYFHFGEFVEKPNQCGCFERNGNWYTYVIDEKNFCTFGGPYSRNGIICACTMILPITMVKEQYNFTEEEFNIYLHNHFHSLEEIDKNVNSNKA